MGFDFTPDFLFVNDREENLSPLKALLEKMGVNFELYRSPFDALNKAKPKKFALIISDIRIPKMNGFVLVQKFRKRDKQTSTPIKFLTAFYLDKKSKQSACKCGYTDYIMKSFNYRFKKKRNEPFLELFKNNKEKSTCNPLYIESKS